MLLILFYLFQLFGHWLLASLLFTLVGAAWGRYLELVQASRAGRLEKEALLLMAILLREFLGRFTSAFLEGGGVSTVFSG